MKECIDDLNQWIQTDSNRKTNQINALWQKTQDQSNMVHVKYDTFTVKPMT